MIERIINNIPVSRSKQEFRREVRGSGTVPLEFNGLEAGKTELWSFSNHDILAGFVPLDFVKVVNNSSETVTVKLDQRKDKAVTLASGISDTIQIGKFRTLEIVNEGQGDIADNEIFIEVMRKPQTREDAYQQTIEKLQGY